MKLILTEAALHDLRANDQVLEIVRVLHSAIDFRRHLPPEAP